MQAAKYRTPLNPGQTGRASRRRGPEPGTAGSGLGGEIHVVAGGGSRCRRRGSRSGRTDGRATRYSSHALHDLPMPNPTALKFAWPRSRIAETACWTVQLRPKQPTLGSLVVVAKEPVTAFSALSPQAFAELRDVTAGVERVLKDFVDYQRINWLMLMMVDPDVHFHVIPRYANLPLQPHSKFFFHTYHYLFTQIINLFTGCISIIYQYQRLFGVHTYIAFPETFPALKFAACFRDDADVFVAHDDGGLGRRVEIELYVGAADAAHFDLQEGGVIGDVWHGIFADFGRAGRGADSGKNFFGHELSS